MCLTKRFSLSGFICILSQKIVPGYNNLPNVVQYNIFKEVSDFSCCFTLALPHFIIISRFFNYSGIFHGQKLLYAGEKICSVIRWIRRCNTTPIHDMEIVDYFLQQSIQHGSLMQFMIF